jgi:hypothetical protein
LKETEALMDRKTFEYIEATEKAMKKQDYDWALLRMIFCFKQDGRR